MITPVLPVKDVESALLYCCEKLGFAVLESPGNGHEWALLSREEGNILLVPKEWPSGFAVKVDHVDATCEQLRSLGADFESGPMNQEYGERDFLVQGPEGYQIRFWAPVNETDEIGSPPDPLNDDNTPF